MKYLVFGATGLLGSEIVEQLIKQKKDVRIFVRERIDNPQVEQFLGNIQNKEEVLKVCAGIDVVFQTVAIIDWNPRRPENLFKINVDGNRNVIEACIEQGVKKLIFTSSIDVVFNGQSIDDGDETLPYPLKYLDHYSESKAMAEKEVISANGTPTKTGVLSTCSLRTAGIYGPNDRVRLPTIIRTLQNGQYMRIGNGKAMFNHVYSGNAAHAHLLAAEALTPDSPVAGQCYFITDHEKSNFFVHNEEILRALGYEIPNKSVSCGLLYVIAIFSELWAKLTKPENPPIITKYTVKANCVHFNFNHKKATRDFGYQPIFSKEECLRLTVEGLRKRGFVKRKEP